MFEREMEDNVPALLMRLSHHYFLVSYNQLLKKGLHPGQLPMLRLLYTRDGISQREIASTLNIKPPTVTMSIKRLEKSGFVYREQDREDQRVSRIYITDTGRELLSQLLDSLLENDRLLLKGFSESELCLIKRFLKQMIENVDAIKIEDGSERRHE